MNCFSKKKNTKEIIYPLKDPWNIKKKYGIEPWWYYCQICNEVYTTYVYNSIYMCNDCRLKKIHSK